MTDRLARLSAILAAALIGAVVGCGGGDASAEAPHVPMTEDEFWQIIEDVHAQTGFDGDRKQERLAAVLEEMPVRRICEFRSWFDYHQDRLYREDVWDAMVILLGGCGDSSFERARASLVGLGREWYERLAADPDELVEFATPAG